MDKRKIIAFSKAAKTYDEHAWLQRQMWDEISSSIKSVNLNPAYILDIGMGTGEHTYELTSIYPQAYTIGFDIAIGMVKYAAVRKLRFSVRPYILQADLNKMPFKERSFDLAISNVVYQRVDDLMKAFLDVQRILRPKGSFCLSLLTKNTLCELHHSFSEAYRSVKGPSLPAVHEHPADSMVIDALNEAGFSILAVKRFDRRPTYASAHEILKWLKGIGANHHYENWISGMGGRAVLKEMDRVYRERYSSGGKIYATFEGLIINARKL